MVLLIFLPVIAAGQYGCQYNINTNNGLPSNHVYWITVDRYGYLWICTDNGIAKYNGYQSRVFNLADGLPNNDIWSVFEDRNGKMWLHTISKDMGYLYKDKYKKAFVKDTFLRMYPRQMRQGPQGILFLNPPFNNDSRLTLCKEINDTIYDCHTNDIYKVDSRSLLLNLLDDSNNIIAITDSNILKISPFDTPIKVKKLCKSFHFPGLRNIDPIWMLFGNKLVIISEAIYTLNIDSCTPRMLSAFQAGEYCITANIAGSYLYIYTNKGIYKFNAQMEPVVHYTPQQLVKEKEGNNGYALLLFEDAFWGNIIATADNGLYVSNAAKDIELSPLNLKGYKYIGSIANNISCWWNKQTQCIACIKNNMVVGTHTYYQLNDVAKLAPYSKDTSILVAGNNTYWLDNRTWQVSYIFANVKYFNDNSGKRSGELAKNPYFRCRDALVVNGKDLYVVELAVGTCKLGFAHDTANIQVLDSDRYNRMFYDPIRQVLGAYNENKVTLFDTHGNRKYSTTSLLSALRTDNIEKIVVDTIYGNVFLKSNNKLFLIDYNGHYQELYTNYRLDNATIYLYGDMLFTAGRFGLLCSKIEGKGRISQPLLYANIKNTLYHEISGIAVSDNTVTLNTDNEVYTVTVPTDAQINNNNSKNILQRYKFLLTYNDSTINIHTGDTLAIDQKNNTLAFDIINPFGRGQVKYTCYINEADTGWHELNTNELHLPTLNPGLHYTLHLIAFDDVWRSNEIKIELFITPYWWQTPYGKKILWAAVLLAAGVLGYIIVFITKRNVLKKNEKRNMQLELELRAIHAQINPHFIFNTLGTALAFIDEEKTEQAYTHISKFSSLLRAYLKSSRSKVITVADEITNLKNYIDLQRTRFDNKFNYTITVQQDIDTHNTRIPSLLLQPIVENAITHGLFHKESGGLLNISFMQTNNDLICVIEDNGIGREQSKIINFETAPKEKKSYGNLLIKDLVNIFNKYERMNISISYTDKPLPQTGTIVTLLIKNQPNDQRV